MTKTSKELQALLAKMTINEKVGQLVQVTPSFFEEVEGTGIVTGLMGDYQIRGEDIYEVGSVLGSYDKAEIASIQQAYLKKNRLGIPLLFMADVIHGMKTIFPIPLALAASFNPEVAEAMASWSAIECQEAGIHLTFSPMVDLTKDPRWGRVMEGNGEDSYLDAQMARAFVRGYQGEKGELATNYAKIGSCVKHFIGYGLVEAGREYNHVSVSKLDLYQNHLPAFQAAIDEGTTLVMTAFNTIDGLPAVGNKPLIDALLRQEMGFKGPVIADWGAINQLMTHGVAEDQAAAAKLAITSGCDIDMMTNSYYDNLATLVDSQQVAIEAIDQAVLRVLQLKADLGLFEDPYRGSQTAQGQTLGTTIQTAARQIGHEAMVLLKNEQQVLPLKPTQRLALIGPKATSQDVLGAWCGYGEQKDAISFAEALTAQYEEVTVVPVNAVHELTEIELIQAKQAARDCDVVILALGEEGEETGEAASKTDICLPAAQRKLIQEIQAVNPTIVTVLFNGRPLDLTDVAERSTAILEAWFLGTQAGNSIVDILSGTVNPSGKLPMTFPMTVGQVPIYYNHMNTGNPLTPERQQEKYSSKYLDAPNTPRYPFGYGLSYSEFILTSEITITKEEPVRVDITCQLKNNGAYAGAEVIQVYLRDRVGQVTRPVKELKRFEKVFLEAGEQTTVQFELTAEDFTYYNASLEKVRDTGWYDLFIGTDSSAEKIMDFYL